VTPGSAASSYGVSSFGVHSEVGRLRKVVVCAPGLAHMRLTPTNSDDLLFDDVMWVENAQRDHADFRNKLTNLGVEVVELHDLLAQTMEIPQARSWLLDRKIVANQVGIGLVDGTRAFLESLSARRLAEFLIGGLATSDLPGDFRSAYVSLARESAGVREYLMPPLPNTSTPETPRAGCMAGSRSTRCSGRPATTRRCSTRRSTCTTRTSRVRWSGGAIRRRTGARRHSRAATSCRSATASS
jgi:hypothetical protein